MMNSTSAQDYTVAVLAGGRGSRLGGADKGLLPAQGKTAVERVLAAIPVNVPRLIIANRNLLVYRHLGLSVRRDPWPDYQGPLAGTLAALQAAKTPWVQILPCDGLALPPNLSPVLLDAASAAHAPAAFPVHGERGQYTCVMIRRDLTASLERALHAGERRLGRWLASVNALPVDFNGLVSPPIWSVNTPEEWRRACGRLTRH